LSLNQVRSVLIRLEETILFGLIERAQFRRNAIVYRPGAFGDVLGGLSLVGYLLHETEKTHAGLRRYTSPDEQPFFTNLPAPLLPPLDYGDSPLAPNSVNINDRVRAVYEAEIVPFICAEGDDRQYGSTAVNDVACLQAISKRVHYGKFVAESKYREAPADYDPLIRAGDGLTLAARITDPSVEDTVLGRVRHKARTYGSEVASAGTTAVDPGALAEIYQRWIIPMNKDVQVRYLLQRLDGAPAQGKTSRGER
jgi:chorismate mutase